jgi:hypothetical protein
MARRLFYVIGQQRNPGHPLKQNGPVKRPVRRRNMHRTSCHARMLSTHLLIVDILSCSNMEWYDDEPMVHAYSLCLFRLGGTSILFLLIHWSNGHDRERCNPKRPLCIGALLNDHHIGLKSWWLASGLVHMLLVRQPPQKGRGQMLSTRNVLADGPALRPDGPRWWHGRSMRAQSQLGFRVSRGIC